VPHSSVYSQPRNVRVGRRLASEPLLAVFISSYGVVIRNSRLLACWLSALACMHSGMVVLLSRTKKGVGKLVPPSSRRPPRDPVSFNHMTILRGALDLSNMRDAAIWTAACTVWRDCARLGESLVDSASSFDPTRHVTRDCPKKRGTAANNHTFVQFKVWCRTQKLDSPPVIGLRQRRRTTSSMLSRRSSTTLALMRRHGVRLGAPYSV
jgi:hypothetical protein